MQQVGLDDSLTGAGTAVDSSLTGTVIGDVPPSGRAYSREIGRFCLHARLYASTFSIEPAMTDDSASERRDDLASTLEASDGPAIDPAVLDLDPVFEVLDHPRRRYLLYALATDSTWTLRELATKLVAWEQDIDETAVHEDQRDRMYVSLYHAHVPKLVEYDVIRFDEEAETIAPAPHAEQVFTVLEGAGASLDSLQEHHAGRAYAAEDTGE